MTDEEREKLKREIEANAALLARIETLERNQRELIAFKTMLDRYKSRLAWAIVLGALALIARPFVNAWDVILAALGLGR